jgi:hypothetical protein
MTSAEARSELRRIRGSYSGAADNNRGVSILSERSRFMRARSGDSAGRNRLFGVVSSDENNGRLAAGGGTASPSIYRRGARTEASPVSDSAGLTATNLPASDNSIKRERVSRRYNTGRLADVTDNQKSIILTDVY